MVVLSEVTGKREKGEKAFAAIPVRYNAIGNIKHNRRSAEGTVEKRQYRGESIQLPELPFSHVVCEAVLAFQVGITARQKIEDVYKRQP